MSFCWDMQFEGRGETQLGCIPVACRLECEKEEEESTSASSTGPIRQMLSCCICPCLTERCDFSYLSFCVNEIKTPHASICCSLGGSFLICSLTCLSSVKTPRLGATLQFGHFCSICTSISYTTSSASWEQELSPSFLFPIASMITSPWFSSVQSLSRVQLFATPWITAHQASLSITNSRSPPKPMSIESMMPSNHLILWHPLLFLPSIFPSIRVFSNESAPHIRWPKY